jgi:hypothetical protein
MSLMLVMVFAAAIVGTMANTFGPRATIACVVIATGLPLIYFLRPWYMT